MVNSEHQRLSTVLDRTTVEGYHFELLNPFPEFAVLPKVAQLGDEKDQSTSRSSQMPFALIWDSVRRHWRRSGSHTDNEKAQEAYKMLAEDIESAGSDSDTGVLPTYESATETTKSGRIDARIISDAIIGLSDGLTVPFALTAGLSALGDTTVVIYGGFAELIAGAISMGLGGFLGAKSEE